MKKRCTSVSKEKQFFVSKSAAAAKKNLR